MHSADASIKRRTPLSLGVYLTRSIGDSLLAGGRLQILTLVPDRVPCDSMQVVLFSKPTGNAQFISLDENPNLREELEKAQQSGAIPLGVLSWERYEGGLRASKFIFPWLKETLVISQIFDDLCNEAARSVEAELVLQTGPVN